MSIHNSQCPNHPSRPVVGICASCLRERLIDLTRLQDDVLIDLSSSSSPQTEFIITKGVCDLTSFGRRKAECSPEGRTNAANVENSSRNLRRTSLFSEAEENSTVANLTEAFHNERYPSKKTLSELFNLDDMEHPKAKLGVDRYPSGKTMSVQNSMRGPSRNTDRKKAGNLLETSSSWEENMINLTWLQGLLHTKIRSKAAKKGVESVEKSRWPNFCIEEADAKHYSSRLEQKKASLGGGARPAVWMHDSCPSFEGYMVKSDGSCSIRGAHSRGAMDSGTFESRSKSGQDKISGDSYVLSEHSSCHSSKLESTVKQTACTTFHVEGKEETVLNKSAMTGWPNREVFRQETPIRFSCPVSNDRTPNNQSARATPSWSKAWSRPLVATSIFWVFRFKHKVPTKKKEMGHDYTAGPKSFSRSTEEAFNNLSRLPPRPAPCQRENRFGNSRVERDKGKVIQKAYKDHDTAFDHSRIMNLLPNNMENGLLRFYLTPLRGKCGSRQKSRRVGGELQQLLEDGNVRKMIMAMKVGMA